MVSVLLEGCERFVVVMGATTMTNLNLVNVRGSLFIDTVLVSIPLWHLVRRSLPLGGFKLVALLEAHFEIVGPLSGFVLLDTSFVNDRNSRLSHTALVFAQVVHLMASKRKVGLCGANASDNLISFLSAFSNR